jgi:hypothetical protein
MHSVSFVGNWEVNFWFAAMHQRSMRPIGTDLAIHLRLALPRSYTSSGEP